MSFSFIHCTICPPIYGSWLPLWYLKSFLADHCLYFCLFPFSIVLSVLRFTVPDYPFGILNIFLQIIVYPFVLFLFPLYYLSFDLLLWLPPWYLKSFLCRSLCLFFLFVISWSFLLRYTASDYSFAIKSDREFATGVKCKVNVKHGGRESCSIVYFISRFLEVY